MNEKPRSYGLFRDFPVTTRILQKLGVVRFELDEKSHFAQCLCGFAVRVVGLEESENIFGIRKPVFHAAVFPLLAIC